MKLFPRNRLFLCIYLEMLRLLYFVRKNDMKGEVNVAPCINVMSVMKNT